MKDGLALIDFGAGNLHSVENALRAAGAGRIIVTSDPDDVLRAERVVLPGVGAFGSCASALRAIPGMVEVMESFKLRFDAAGKIVEHWDVLQVIGGTSANNNGLF